MQLHPLWPIVFVFLAACWPTWEGWHTAQDHDSDGYKSEQAGGEDCDDTNKTINPDAVEICDGLDNDCDGAIDDADDNVTGLLLWHLDADNDGFGDPDSRKSIEACEQPEGYLANATDCDDGSAAVYPGATYLCDGLINDCHETEFEDEEIDNDGDGYVECEAWVGAKKIKGGDCNDDLDADAPDIHPGAAEICDDIDNDCDTDIDEEAIDRTYWYFDKDNDSFGDGDDTTPALACDPTADRTADNNNDCDDHDADEKPGAQWYQDQDGDSYGDNASSSLCQRLHPTDVSDSSDCDDAAPRVYPNAPEVCDGWCNDCTDPNYPVVPADEVDNDSDGYVECTVDFAVWWGANIIDGDDCDDGDPTVLGGHWYPDNDNDGYGDSSATVTISCTQPDPSMVDNNDDCNDNSAVENPEVTWYLDGDGDGQGDPDLSNNCERPDTD